MNNRRKNGGADNDGEAYPERRALLETERNDGDPRERRLGFVIWVVKPRIAYRKRPGSGDASERPLAVQTTPPSGSRMKQQAS